MQIYLVGAHNTGKTELAKAISKYTGLCYVPEIAKELLSLRRDLLAKYNPTACHNKLYSKDTPESVSAKESWIYLNEYEHATFQSLLFFWFRNLHNDSSFISDRSLIDVFAYTSYVYENKITNPLLQVSTRMLLKELMKTENYDLRSDTLYIHCIDDEKIKTNNDPSHFIIHHKIASMLKLLGIKKVTLSYNSNKKLSVKGPFYVIYKVKEWQLCEIDTWVWHLVSTLEGFLKNVKVMCSCLNRR